MGEEITKVAAGGKEVRKEIEREEKRSTKNNDDGQATNFFNWFYLFHPFLAFAYTAVKYYPTG